MNKKDWSYLFGMLLGVTFLLAGIEGVYVKNIYNLFFTFLGGFTILLNADLLLNKNK